MPDFQNYSSALNYYDSLKEKSYNLNANNTEMIELWKNFLHEMDKFNNRAEKVKILELGNNRLIKNAKNFLKWFQLKEEVEKISTPAENLDESEKRSHILSNKVELLFLFNKFDLSNLKEKWTIENKILYINANWLVIDKFIALNRSLTEIYASQDKKEEIYSIRKESLEIYKDRKNKISKGITKAEMDKTIYDVKFFFYTSFSEKGRSGKEVAERVLKSEKVKCEKEELKKDLKKNKCKQN